MSEYPGFYENLPKFVKMIYTRAKNNAKVLSILENSSSITVSSAGGKEIGRGTKNNCVHASEVAFWDKPDLILSGLIQSVPDNTDNNNLIIYESTANGNNFFREIFEEGLKDKTSLFFGWHQFGEYRKRFHSQEERDAFKPTEAELNMHKAYKLTKEQLYWRREKIKEFKGREKLFDQEYPTCWQEAFISSGERCLIEVQYIYKAANNNLNTSELQPIINANERIFERKDITILHRLKQSKNHKV